MTRSSHWAFVAAALGTGLSAAVAVAQYNVPQIPVGIQWQQLQQVDLKGTVDRVQPQVINLKCNGKAFVLHVDANYTRVLCTGSADRGYLKPGVMVRFEAELDKKWQAKEPLEEIFVVTASDTAQPGIHWDEPAGDDEQPRAKKRAAHETYAVVGTIKAFKDGQLQIVADGKSVKAAVAKDAKIKVEIDDYTLAAPEDEITVKGRQAQAPTDQLPGQLYGEEVSIELAKPLASTSKVAKSKKPAKAAKRPAR